VLGSGVGGDRHPHYFGESSAEVTLAIANVRRKRSDVDVALLEAATQRDDGGDSEVHSVIHVGSAPSTRSITGVDGVAGGGEEFYVAP
jgi:hypothetical protein